jgi:hypothetical protein
MLSSPCVLCHHCPVCHVTVTLCAMLLSPCALCRRRPAPLAVVALCTAPQSTCTPCCRHPVRHVAVDLCPSSSPPCVPHHCRPAHRIRHRPVHHVAVALCPSSSSPCVPCHSRPAPLIVAALHTASLSPCAPRLCHPVRHIVVSLHAASPLPCAPHQGPVHEPANPNLCGRITGFSVRFWFSPWRTPNQTTASLSTQNGGLLCDNRRHDSASGMLAVRRSIFLLRSNKYCYPRTLWNSKASSSFQMCLTTLSSVPSQVRGNASDKAMGTWQRGRTGLPVILWVPLAGHNHVRTPTWQSATLAGQGGSQRRGLRGARPKRAPVALAGALLCAVWTSGARSEMRGAPLIQHLDHMPLETLASCTPKALLGLPHVRQLHKLVVLGGAAGYGNPHFPSTTNPSPKFMTHRLQGRACDP